MKTIGITGGVGAGKSTVLGFLETAFRAVVCEADKVAHMLQEPGEVCYEGIIEEFGCSILAKDGKIDREKLGSIVFLDEKKLQRLNRIIHPQVKAYIRKKKEEEKVAGTQIFVIEAALLIEDHYEEICDELWYIHTPDEIRRKRLKESRGYSDARIDGIMKNQKSEEQFRKACDVVIENGEDFKETCIQIKEALESY